MTPVKDYTLGCSLLIKSDDHFNFISNILRKRMNGLFKLRLLFRGTRDGMTNAKFHELCDNKGPLLVVIKTQKDILIGGFCSISWKNSGGWVVDPKCVVFSITRKKVY
jgi:hypothetical protein